MTFTSNNETDLFCQIGVTDSPTSQIFTGDGISGLHARGMQLNEGSLADYVESIGTPVSGGGNTDNPFSFNWVRG